MSGLTLTFSASVSKSLKHEVKDYIMDSLHEDKALRKEMMYYFKLANDRIRNLEAAGIASPALAHLEGRFYSSPDWFTMKERYAEAIAFLNQPTSTVRGTRTFKNYVQKRAGLEDKPDLFEEIYQGLADRFNDVVDEFTANLNYKDIVQAIYEEASASLAEQIEMEARERADDLEQQIEREAERMGEYVQNLTENMADEIIDSFRRMGL